MKTTMRRTRINYPYVLGATLVVAAALAAYGLIVGWLVFGLIR
jgi:hypothetical protein